MNKSTQSGNPQLERVALVCLNRQGGMVHYHSHLVNALSNKINAQAFIAQAVSHDIFLPSVNLYKHDLGHTIFGTLLFILNPATYWKLLKQIKTFNPQIVHVTSTYVAHVLPVIFIRVILKKKIVFTIHDPILHEGDSMLNRLTLRVLKAFSQGYVVHAKTHQDSLHTNKPVAVVPIGIFDFPIKRSPKSALDQIDEENSILFFGRIEPYKGLDILLKSAPQIFAALPDWKIIIAGKGSLEPYQHSINTNRFECINRFIEDEEISVLMKRAKIVVLPYLSATQSGVIPLAYAFSKAIVSTAVGAIPEILVHGETGLLVEPNNAPELAQAIIRLAQDPDLRERLGKAGCRYANRTLDWGRIGETHIEFYQQIFLL